MKKTLIILLVACFFVSIALMGISCKAEEEAVEEEAVEEEAVEEEAMEEEAVEEEASVAEKVIAFMPEQVAVKRWMDADVPSFEARAAELGYETIVQVAGGDAEKQIKQAEGVLQQNISAIVIVPADFDAARKIVEMANEVNVPVISYNDLITGIEIAGFV